MSGIVSKSVKNACFFPIFGFFWGWLIVVHLGLEGLGVFVFLVFVFLFCLAFVSVLFALLLVLWLDVVVFFCCFFVFVCFCLLFFSFQISCLFFPETSFSKRAVVTCSNSRFPPRDVRS